MFLSLAPLLDIRVYTYEGTATIVSMSPGSAEISDGAAGKSMQFLPPRTSYTRLAFTYLLTWPKNDNLKVFFFAICYSRLATMYIAYMQACMHG